MEMMDIQAATRQFESATNVLVNARKALEALPRTPSDPEIQAHMVSFRESVEKLLRDTSIEAIACYRMMAKQVSLLLGYPGDLAMLIAAQNRFTIEKEQTSLVFEKTAGSPVTSLV